MRIRSLLVLSLFAAQAASAMELPKEQVEFFESKVRPILTQKCYKCHSLEEGKAKGGLTLDTKGGLLKGGDTGTALKPGNPDASLLIQAITYEDADLQMPPKGEKLADAEIAILKSWVKMGAPDPRLKAKGTKLTGLTEASRQHWAYQPIVKPAIPAVKNRAWCVTQVDAFVMEKLEDRGMTPMPTLGSAEKEKLTLLRRATYDLTGLPPTMEEQNAFLADQTPYAFARVVERLLASKHYGERWGRFWLDTARYADTTGGENNAQRADYRYPYAYTYRDWVVQAINDDLPYDQFIIQQLAADKVPNNKKENLAALGFITVGERFGNNNDTINDRIDVVTKGFQGLTVSCARCHDHMFDPIPTKDYYSLHGIFSSTVEPAEKPVIKAPSVELQAQFEKRVAEIEAANREKYYKTIADVATMFRPSAVAYLVAGQKRRSKDEAELQAAEKMIADQKLNVEVLRLIQDRTNRNDPVFGGLRRALDMPDQVGKAMTEFAADKKANPLVVAFLKEAKPANVDQVLEAYGKLFAAQEGKVKGVISAYAAALDAKAGVAGTTANDADLATMPLRLHAAHELDTAGLRQATNRWPMQIQNRAGIGFAAVNQLLLTHDGAPARAMVVADSPNPRNSSVFIRGQAETKGEVAPRRFLEVFAETFPDDFKNGSGRYELAQCIASKKNPLTARVLVNRVWMHHFGQGFVRTPDDLGVQSEKPSHPELLDYLAWWVMDQGWSLKKLHKLIMLSRVYQIGSDIKQEYVQMDPENRLLWRANVRRLDFEAMRDSLLVMSGRLDRTVGGQPVNLTDEPYSYRRSVYGYIDRGNLPELMSHFDFSNPDMPNSARTTTIVPQQALFLMNSPMSVDVARRVLTQKAFMEAGHDTMRVNAIYRVVLQRNATPQEHRMAIDFVSQELRKAQETATQMKDVTAKATEAAKKRAEARANSMRGDAAIQNEGQVVERRALSPWETLAHTLLFTNEAAYVN